MNGLVGSSLYDTLNKMLIGCLFLMPFFSFVSSEPVELLTKEVVYVMMFSWIAGLFIWVVLSLWVFPSIPQNLPLLNNNNNKWIAKAYRQVSNRLSRAYPEVSSIESKDYLVAYYRVQRNGLLGNIPVLECYSEFFRNLSVVFIVWIILIAFNSGCGRFIDFGPVRVCQCPDNGCCISPLCAIGICIISIFFCLMARKSTEEKIYRLILEADLTNELYNNS